MTTEFNMNYGIKNGNIVLNGVENFVKCAICNQNVAICYADKILVKTFVTLIDVSNGNIVIKCGKCKTFNSVKMENANTKKSKCLLMM